MIDELVDLSLSKGFDEVAIKREKIKRMQVRFSNSEIDIVKEWNEDVCDIYLFKGKKMYHTFINTEYARRAIEEAVKFIRHSPPNPLFIGLNPEKQSYRSKNVEIEDVDLVEYAKEGIEGAISKGAKRVAGVAYFNYETTQIATNYNFVEDVNSDVHLVVRAFSHNSVGQWAAITSRKGGFDPREVGEIAGNYATICTKVEEGKEGNYDVLFAPLSFGTLLSYSMRMLSSYYVETQASMFTNLIGQRVASESLTLYDDPTYPLRNSRIADDEGTATKKNKLIDKGVLNNYLHNYSSAKRMNMENTANAGIIAPMPWIINVEGGKREFNDMLSEMKKGLFIVNSWYTRFQNYRTGDFSTIPRDGVFYIEDGEIKSVWRNIRVSDNMLRILKNIAEVSRERREVAWWGEVMPSVLPYALIKDVKITRAK